MKRGGQKVLGYLSLRILLASLFFGLRVKLLLGSVDVVVDWHAILRFRLKLGWV